MLCTERTLVKHQANTLTLSPLRCRCWTCDHCGPRRAKDLRRLALRGDPTTFLTLTIRKGRFPTPDAQAVELAKGWRMLRQYLMRFYGLKALPFLIVIEKHKSGWPHAHILLRAPYLDHNVIRNWWAARFDSRIIDIRQVKDQHQAAKYVTDYLSKGPHAYAGTKRYWRSQDYELRPDEFKATEYDETVWWTTVDVRPITVATMALNDGARGTYFKGKWLIARWDHRERSKWGVE